MKKYLIGFSLILSLTACGSNQEITANSNALNETPSSTISEDDLYVQDILPESGQLKALTLFGGTRYGGTTGARFAAYYDQSVIDFGYVSAFDAARAAWNPISTQVQIDRNTGNYSAANDIYYVLANNKLPTLAQTTFLKPNPDGSGTYIANTSDDSDMHHSQIVMYNGSMINQYTDTTQRSRVINKTAIHEIGHTLKLAHAPDTETSIMRTYVENQPTSIQPYDTSELIRKWGK